MRYKSKGLELGQSLILLLVYSMVIIQHSTHAVGCEVVRSVFSIAVP